MQDRYAGDIGDFGKYALLNALAGKDLRLGVHWYLNADEELNNDGKFTRYLQLRDCDPALHDSLNAILTGDRRSVNAVESAGILPGNTIFYSRPLSFRDATNYDERSVRRESWTRQALETLAPAQLVFLDPDNGLECRSVPPGHRKGVKYVFYEEIRAYRDRAQSVIVYHHQTREKVDATLTSKFTAFRDKLGYENVWAFVFRRVSIRLYFILPTPAHTAILQERTAKFRESLWATGKKPTFVLRP